MFGLYSQLVEGLNFTLSVGNQGGVGVSEEGSS